MVVHKIEAKKPQQGTGIPVKRLLKVAAYCRVSTEQDEQQNSYEAQIEHYNGVIAEHKDWLNAGIYKTCTGNFENFNRRSAGVSGS